MEQEMDSDWFGWVWVDSTTAVHNIRDRQSHVNHRTANRIRSCIGIDSFVPYIGCTAQGKVRQVTIERSWCRA
jgi:hypothetical protein